MRCPNCKKWMGEIEPATTHRGNRVRGHWCPDCELEIQEFENPDAAGSNTYITYQQPKRIGATE